MPGRCLMIFFTGFAVAVISTIILRAVTYRNKLLQKEGFSLVGGLSIGLAFFCAVFLGEYVFSGLPREFQGILLASLIMLVFGLLDDVRELSVRIKFLVQIISASILLIFGVRTRIVYIGYFANLIITLIWIIGITNAFNLLDIGDGLAGGAVFIISIAYFVIAFSGGDVSTMIFSLALAGASLGFLIFNYPPAKVYMGNTGSHFLGLCLAACALVIKYATMERKIALLSPLLILGLPIFDTAFVILVRLARGKNPFNKSKDHLYYRFLKSGYSAKKALLVMSGLCLLFSSAGMLLVFSSGLQGVIIVGSIVCVTATVSKKMIKIKIDG